MSQEPDPIGIAGAVIVVFSVCCIPFEKYAVRVAPEPIKNYI